MSHAGHYDNWGTPGRVALNFLSSVQRGTPMTMNAHFLSAILLLATCFGCQKDIDDASASPGDGGVVAAGDGGVVAAPDGALPEDNEPANQRFSHSAARVDCDEAGDPRVTLILSQRPGCDPASLGNDRIELQMAPAEGVPFPIEAGDSYMVSPRSAVSATYVDDDGESHSIVAGRVSFDTFEVDAGAQGSFALLTSRSERIEGRFDATTCAGDMAGGEPPACWPDARPEDEPPEEEPPEEEPPVELECDGRFTVTEWSFSDALSAISPRYINPLFQSDLDRGELLLDIILDMDAGTVEFRDVIIDEVGDRVQDPRVPLAPPVAIEEMADGLLRMPAPSTVSLYLSAADYPGAVPFVLAFFEFQFEGRFDEDCSGLEGTMRGAFADSDEFSIPGMPDADTNGDGVLNGFWMGGPLRAER